MFSLRVCVCVLAWYPVNLVNYIFNLTKWRGKGKQYFLDPVYYLHPLWEISYYFKDQITDFNKTIHRFTSLYLALSWYLKTLICLNKSKTLAVCPSDSTQWNLFSKEPCWITETNHYSVITWQYSAFQSFWCPKSLLFFPAEPEVSCHKQYSQNYQENSCLSI